MRLQIGDVFIPDWYNEHGQVFISLGKLPEAHWHASGKARHVCLVGTTSWLRDDRGRRGATWQACICSDDVIDDRIEIK